MTTWTDDELSRIGEAQELQLASARRDGDLRAYVTMWVVRVGDDLYVRSAYGANNPWYRRAKASGSGRLRAGGVERDVSFAEPRPGRARGHRRRLPRQVRPVRPRDRRHGGRPRCRGRDDQARAAFNRLLRQRPDP